MKTYKIQITDDEGGTGWMGCKAINKTEARKIARLYIRQWRLKNAKIDCIVEDDKNKV